MDWVFDSLLVAGLLWLSWRVVMTPSLFRAIILFIVFGLLMALAWARLAAPDVALAEAAIGAGLTGALLLDVYRDLLPADRRNVAPAPLSAPPAVVPSLVLVLLCLGLTGGLAWALLTLPEPVPALGSVIRARLAESGVANPVTAVLLNFRAYDTLLEIAVLTVALLGVGAVNEKSKPIPAPTSLQDLALANTLIHQLAPLAVLIGGYLLWAGAHAPGGAFQAGAVLAGLGVLLRLADWVRPADKSSLIGIMTILGLTVFCAVALGVVVAGNNLLQYPPAWAGLLILVIESALTVSIALILVLLFSGSLGLRRKKP